MPGARGVQPALEQLAECLRELHLDGQDHRIAKHHDPAFTRLPGTDLLVVAHAAAVDDECRVEFGCPELCARPRQKAVAQVRISGEERLKGGGCLGAAPRAERGLEEHELNGHDDNQQERMGRAALETAGDGHQPA